MWFSSDNFTRYPRIRPFWSVCMTSPHVTFVDVEEMGFEVMFVGDPVGPGNAERNVLQCDDFNQSHLGIFIQSEIENSNKRFQSYMATFCYVDVNILLFQHKYLSRTKKLQLQSYFTSLWVLYNLHLLQSSLRLWQI